MLNDLSCAYDLAKSFVLQTDQHIFLTGKAGTGKTTFLHNLKEQTAKQIAVVAPTGIAAINAGGVTMHSFFQLPLSPFIPTPEGKKKLIEKSKMRSLKRKILQELELLIIDEISMVRADTLDAVDTILRHVRLKQEQAFGGVQVIFIGDMFQLPPVISEEEWRLLSKYYESPYFFHSHVIMEAPPVYIELDKIYRQSDELFIRILNEVRENTLSTQGLQLLQSKYDPLFNPPPEESYITLTTHNYKADRINAEELAKLPGETICFSAKIKGEFNEKNYPADPVLHLKTGAKVMLIKNDLEIPRRFYNGKIGVIEDIGTDSITLTCPEDNSTIEIFPMEWENIQYTVHPDTQKIEEEVIGKFIQFPLRLAWAITIHKSQGLTFDKVVIDAEDAFASGQVYVALSRCRSLEGLVLLSKINPYGIENDYHILKHAKQKKPLDILEREFQLFTDRFRVSTLKNLFDFSRLSSQFNRFMKSMETIKSSFNEETSGYLQQIAGQLTELKEVGFKFADHIMLILMTQADNEDFLTERLEAAVKFFAEKIKKLTDTLKQSPALTDNRENAGIFNEHIKSLFTSLARQEHIMRNLQYPFSVENYFSLKNKFEAPKLQVNAYSKFQSPRKIESRHPDLYFKLLKLRNRICDSRDIPIYLVAGSKTIQEMADYLPLSEKELLLIHGFGKSKVEKYGKEFLDVITEYCLENNLSSRMYKKSMKSK